MVKSKTASASARPTETAQRKTVLVAKCLTAFLAALLLSGWSIWSEEKDPEKLLDEMADQSAKLYKRCTGLAIDAELALREFPKERQEIIDRWREENITPKPKGGGYAALYRKAAGNYALEREPKQWPGHLDILPDPTDYDEECGEKVKFCLLPPEPMTKVEEFSYQVRTCLRPSAHCGSQRGNIAWILEEKKRLHLAKNQACRSVTGPDLCIYRYRQVLSAIQAIAFHETFLERVCLED